MSLSKKSRAYPRGTLTISGFRGTKIFRSLFIRAAHISAPGYDLSLAFVKDKKARALNKQYRGKSYAPNVLAFPLTPKSGEIVINQDAVKREAPDFFMSAKIFTLFLFIHGCLHLVGYRHGATMDETERRLLGACMGSATTTNGKKNRNRNRHRNARSKNRRY